ncbi:MAG: Cobalt-zinc-cadmium resistance protein CzcA [Phycisphaerae bacterium]|nr:Cobalt-zinc-cadmium resistance protein CzcA [Phycisphaerae bacterium]
MLEYIIDWSLKHRFLVIVLSVLFIVSGVYAALHLPMDAFPDTTPVQVQINTVAPAFSPTEIEQQITLSVEQALAGIPGLLEVRSISKFGLSQVTVTFEDRVDVYFARQMIGEKLQAVELPEGISRPEMGPVATGLGEIYHYVVIGDEKYSLTDLTTIQNWIIKPRLLEVSGVAEVNTWGGVLKQYQVVINPQRLFKYHLTIDDLIDALQQNNLTVGGGNIVQAGEVHLVQGIALTTTLEEIANIVVAAHQGVPIRMGDVSEIQIGHEIRRGATTANGEGEAVLGLVFLLMGENSHAVTRHIADHVAEVQATLPEGVQIKPLYVRSDLVDHVIRTVKTNLMEGALLVVAVLFVFLGNLRAGLIVALAIPLSMLFAAHAMLRFGIAGSLMSLGAIDFGLIVDSSVIMVENSLRHLATNNQKSLLDTVREASIEVRKPTMFGELIIMIVYLPILTLEGMEGKLFRPMALTVIFALLGSLILSMTLMPVLSSLLLPRRAKHGDNFVIRVLKNAYRPILRTVLRFSSMVVGIVLLLAAGGVWLAMHTGSEFIPRLSEEAITINTVRLAGVSLEESVRYGTQIEKMIRQKFPDEVRDVWTRTGTAEVATDPMGLEVSDAYLTLYPREQWRRARTQKELEELLSQELSGLPGMRLVFSQPIEMRINEMVAGIRSDLGVKIFGDDLEILKSKAAEVQKILESIPGSADVYAEQLTGQPVIEVRINQEALARFGIPAQQVLQMIEAIGGVKVSEIREAQRRFDLVVKLDEPLRRDPAAISQILLATAQGQKIPLASVATIRQIEGPSTLIREWQRRRIVVQCSVRGRDIASFVSEAQQRIRSALDLPASYHIAYGGQFEHLQRASERLMIVVPIALGLIFVLLYLTYNRFADVIRIFLALPISAVGGLVALHLRDMPFSISAGIGFVAMSGVAVLGDMVFVSYLRQLLDRGASLLEAIEQTALTRLRPVLMTGLVASLGFVPMAFNTGVGAEVQRPLATVVIGAIITSTLLTLVVLPALYVWFAKNSSRQSFSDPLAVA